MSKIIKSLLSIMTAFLLLMTMAVTNVNAANMGGGSSGTGIFIRNPRVGHTYKAYKVLDLNPKQTSVSIGKSFTTEAEAQAWTNANGGYYYQSSEWDSTTQTYITVYKCNTNTTYNLYSISTSNPFYSVVSSYSGLTLSDTDDPAVKNVVVENSFSAKEFVKLIRPIMETETPVIEATATTTAPLKLTVSKPGYYALNTTVGTVIDTVNDLNPDGQVYIDDKNAYYELKTTVSDHDVEIGDVVKFTVLVDTPKEITDFGDDYVFEVNTTIPEGLKFNGDVKIGGLYDEEPIRWQLQEQNAETGTGKSQRMEQGQLIRDMRSVRWLMRLPHRHIRNLLKAFITSQHIRAFLCLITTMKMEVPSEKKYHRQESSKETMKVKR